MMNNLRINLHPERLRSNLIGNGFSEQEVQEVIEKLYFNGQMLQLSMGQNAILSQKISNKDDFLRNLRANSRDDFINIILFTTPLQPQPTQSKSIKSKPKESRPAKRTKIISATPLPQTELDKLRIEAAKLSVPIDEYDEKFGVEVMNLVLINNFQAFCIMCAPTTQIITSDTGQKIHGMELSPGNAYSISTKAVARVYSSLNNIFSNWRKFYTLLTPLDQGGLGFKMQHICSISNKSGGGIGEVLDQLLENELEIRQLLKPIKEGGIGFKHQNISSILNSAGINAGSGLKQIYNNQGRIRELLKPIKEGGIGLTLDGLSSILNKTRARFEEALNKISDNKERIIELFKPLGEGGLGLSPNNVSNLLNGSGVNIDESLNIIFANQEKMRELLKPKAQGGQGQNVSYVFPLIRQSIQDAHRQKR